MKKILVLIICLLIAGVGFSQNALGKTEDAGRISLNPVVSDEISGMPAEASRFLHNKLQQVATLNGLGAAGTNPRFIITANVAILTRDIIQGPPAMIAQNLEVTFYIADYQQKKVFSTTSLLLKGVGTNETKAYIEAIKNIKPSAPDLKMFVETGKNKIIEYYNSQCDFIIRDAQAKASQKHYQEAIYTLTAIPEVCKDCYMKVLSIVGPVYKQYIDDNCRKLLNTARNTWNGNQNSAGADAAGMNLSAIDPEASCYGEAKQLMGQIEQKVLADENRSWNFKMKQYEDGVSLETQRIEACRAVGVAYGTNQPDTVYNLKGWLWQ
jgi:hypothetical protein